MKQRRQPARGSKKSAKARVVRIVVVLAALAAASYFGIDLTGGPSDAPRTENSTPAAERGGSVAGTNTDRTEQHAIIARLMRAEQSDTMVTLSATIVRVLPEDTEGSRHQKFIVRIEAPDAPSDTVLIAHNIDLAPRVPASVGDDLLVRGEYEHNELGGVIHWTHHDPKEWREGGWIEHKGERYE